MAARLQTISKHLNSTVRAMSSTAAAPRKFEWLVVVPDFPGALQKRLEVRPYVFTSVPPKFELHDEK